MVKRKTSSSWITDRKPTKNELHVVFQRDEYKAYGGRFLVWNGQAVFIDKFNMPPKPGCIEYYPGYWENDQMGPLIQAWMPLPEPPNKI